MSENLSKQSEDLTKSEKVSKAKREKKTVRWKQKTIEK